MALRLLGLINFSVISYNIDSRLVILVPTFALGVRAVEKTTILQDPPVYRERTQSKLY